ncbi:hypothetical protein B0H19DRAFT_1366692, partial [Mycena capillaripes]
MARRTRNSQGLDGADEREYMQYTLDLGAGTPSLSLSASPIPTPSLPRRESVSVPPKPKVKRFDSNTRRARENECDCGICFEHAVAPVRTPCCGHVFCAEHIAAWLHGPASDGRCPACRSRDPSPTRSACSSSSTDSDSVATFHDAEEEDLTDYSFPALTHARFVQARRQASHPLSSVLGVHGAALSLVRALGCVVVVAWLAGGGGGGFRVGVGRGIRTTHSCLSSAQTRSLASERVHRTSLQNCNCRCYLLLVCMYNHILALCTLPLPAFCCVNSSSEVCDETAHQSSIYGYCNLLPNPNPPFRIFVGASFLTYTLIVPRLAHRLCILFFYKRLVGRFAA